MKQIPGTTFFSKLKSLRPAARKGVPVVHLARKQLCLVMLHYYFIAWCMCKTQVVHTSVLELFDCVLISCERVRDLYHPHPFCMLGAARHGSPDLKTTATDH